MDSLVLAGGFGPFGGWELLLFLFVVLLLFGSKRLPSLARSIGQSVKEFKSGVKQLEAPDDDPEPEKVKKDNSSAFVE